MVGSALASLPTATPNVSFILRNTERLRDYLQYGSQVTIKRLVVGTNSYTEVVREIPAVARLPRESDRKQQQTGRTISEMTGKSYGAAETIDNLVVTVKSGGTLAAMDAVLPSITPDTNILLLQNGVGSYDKLCQSFWPNPGMRPNFLLGITTHGVNPDLEKWTFKHVGHGGIKLAAVPNEAKGIDPADIGAQLVNSFMRTGSALNAQVVDYFPDFMLAQYEKLVCNAVINPLTALFECYNGEVLALSSADFFINRIVTEAARVFTAHFQASTSPELFEANRGMIATGLNVDRLVAMVMDVINTTKDNRSSMLQDVLILKDTEISSINGHIVNLGKLYKIQTPHNRMLLEMVKSKLALGRDRTKRLAPVVNGGVLL